MHSVQVVAASELTHMSVSQLTVQSSVHQISLRPSLDLVVAQLQLATRVISRSMTAAPTVAATIVSPKIHG
jgi:hypothetical protein